MGFCMHSRDPSDPFLILLSFDERELFVKDFLQCYRTTDWTLAGSVAGVRQKPVVAGTIRKAAGRLAAAFRSNMRDSPMHIKAGPNLRPFVKSLLKAYENEDPPKYQQRAITPKLLRAMFTASGAGLPATKGTRLAIITELAIVAFFYAMRSCEITQTPRPGRTKPIRLGGVVFRDAAHRELDQTSSTLADDAERVTITFEDQKNGTRMDKRTHQRTDDPVLCPVRRLASIVTRIHQCVPNASADTTLNTMFLSTKVS